MVIQEKIRHADGSGVSGSPEDQAKSHHHPPSSVQPVEAEDPKESAGDQHLQKRILNETVEGGAASQHPDSPAGQHATGSFTGPAPVQPSKTPKKNGHR